MMKRKKGKHTSAGKKLKLSLQWLEGYKEAERVILSFTESCRTTYPPGYLRYTRDAPGGVNLVGHSGNGVVKIFVKVSDENKEKLLKTIKKKFE